MKLWVDTSGFVATWVAHRIPDMLDHTFGPHWATGVISDDKMIAGCVYHNYYPKYRCVDISFAAESPKWMTRNIVHDLLAGAFYGMDVNRISMVTTTDATRTRKILEGLGMTLECAEAKEYFGDKDAVLYRLLRREWEAGRWFMKERPHGQKVIASGTH